MTPPSPSSFRRPSRIKTSADDPLLKQYIPPSPSHLNPTESLLKLSEILEGFHIFRYLPDLKRISESDIEALKQSKGVIRRAGEGKGTSLDPRMEQSKATDALEKWTGYAPSAATSSPILAELTKNALNEQDGWVYAELREAVLTARYENELEALKEHAKTQGLEVPANLKLKELKAHLEQQGVEVPKDLQSEWSKVDDMTGDMGLLNIFSYGIWKDYTDRKESHKLPDLTADQTRKLKQLSIRSLCSSHSTLTYAYLQKALDIPTITELESLITNTIYAGLVKGILNPKDQRFEPDSVAPLRDLAPGSIPQLQDALGILLSNCESEITDLEAQIAEVHKNAKLRAEKMAARELQIKQAMEKEEKGGNKRVGDEGDEGDVMEIDDENIGKKTLRNLKKGALGLRRG